jgi:hypothetical protein
MFHYQELCSQVHSYPIQGRKISDRACIGKQGFRESPVNNLPQGAYDAFHAHTDTHLWRRCRHCGAQYVVKYTDLPVADSGSAYCADC